MTTTERITCWHTGREHVWEPGDWCPAIPSNQYGRPGDGPFCEEQWDRGPGARLLVCQRGPKHLAGGRPHKDVGGLLWSDEERTEGRLR